MVPVGTMDEVVARLERLESSLPVSDGVHWFNRMYLEVTLVLRDYIAHHTQQAPGFLERLVVFFGKAYFAAVDGAAAHPPKVAPAWSPLFDARRDPRIAPLQFAAAGMNAHVGHLPSGWSRSATSFQWSLATRSTMTTTLSTASFNPLRNA